MQGPFHCVKSAGLAAAVLFGGCSGMRPAVVPLRTLDLRTASGPPARCLVVLLPGRFDSPEDFARHGFAEAAARAGSGCDLVAVDAHLGYYKDRTVVDRLREDVMAPARQRYDRIWLAGISLGGTGSLLYTIEHPDDVAGLLLIAPFLGAEPVVGEIAAAGGVSGWAPPQPLAREDFQRRLWAWLKTYQASGGERIPVYIGWGLDDRFARANALFGTALPPDRVFTAPGGHGWKAWRALWETFLASGALTP